MNYSKVSCVRKFRNFTIGFCDVVFSCSELKDSLSGDVAESDASVLLKALLARDPAVFKGGTTAGMYMIC